MTILKDEAEKVSNIRQKVDQLIGDVLPLPNKVFLGAAEWQDFVKEVEPIYKEQYEILLFSEEATMQGYTNILYKGIAVCLDKEAQP